jgi:hypothetical protein
MLGLAVVAVAALLAFVGASSASATVLCKTTPETGSPATTGTTCPEGWAYGNGTVNHAVNVGPTSLHTSFKTIECGKSTFQGTTENEGSATETVKGTVEALTFEECNCEVKVLAKGTFELHWISDSFNATITVNGQEITSTCSTIFGNVHCIYVTNNKDAGTIVGSETHTSGAILHVNTIAERKTTNALCDEQANWTATYEATTPKPLWFANHT